MEYAFLLFEQIGIMFLIILLGFILFKVKVITEQGRKQLSEVLLTIVIPSLVIMAYQIDVTPKIMKGILWSYLLSAISIIIGIFIARICIKDKMKNFRMCRMCIGYTNCAFMGIPLIEALFGSEGVLYLTSYITLFNIFAWTHGIMLVTDEKSFKGLLKVMKNPTIISVAVGILLFVAGIKLPKVIASSLDYIKMMNTPIAMLVAGATMAESNLLKALKEPNVMLPVALRLVIVPVVVVALFKLLPVPSEVIFTTNMIAAACPTATIVTLFAIRYNRNAVRASEIFAISTLLSGITLPLVVLLSEFVFYL